MRKKIGILSASILLLVGLMGCAQAEAYTKEFSLEKIYQAHDGSLSILPWFTTLEDAKEILDIDEIPKQDIEEDMDSNTATLVIQNVKLKEFRYPMQFKLSFQKNIPLANTEDFVLCDYNFTLNEVDGEALDHTMNPNKEERIFQQYEKDRVAWLKTADQKYKEKPDKISPDSEELYLWMAEDRNSPQYLQCTFPNWKEPIEIRLTYRAYIIWAQIKI